MWPWRPICEGRSIVSGGSCSLLKVLSSWHAKSCNRHRRYKWLAVCDTTVAHPASVCLTFWMSFRGSLIWTVSVPNAHRSSGHLTIEPRQNMIKLKRVYESMRNDDSKKFLVERLWPRGVKKTALANAVWLKDVAPSTELRKWFGHDPKRWEDFQRRYRVELKEHQAVLESILQAARRGTVTLLYSSHDTEHNNAVVLRNYLQRKLGSDRPLKPA